jgi:hypothetical protein
VTGTGRAPSDAEQLLQPEPTPPPPHPTHPTHPTPPHPKPTPLPRPPTCAGSAEPSSSSMHSSHSAASAVSSWERRGAPMSSASPAGSGGSQGAGREGVGGGGGVFLLTPSLIEAEGSPALPPATAHPPPLLSMPSAHTCNACRAPLQQRLVHGKQRRAAAAAACCRARSAQCAQGPQRHGGGHCGRRGEPKRG